MLDFLDFVKRNAVNGAILAGAGACVYAPPAALVNLVTTLAATPVLAVFGAAAPYVAAGLIAAVSVGVVWGVASAVSTLIKDLVRGIETGVVMLVSGLGRGLWNGAGWLLGKIFGCGPTPSHEEHSDNTNSASSTTVTLIQLGGSGTDPHVNKLTAGNNPEINPQNNSGLSYDKNLLDKTHEDVSSFSYFGGSY